MHRQVEEKMEQDTRPAFIGQNWEMFLPAGAQDAALTQQPDDTRSALSRAEGIIRAQEDRIRLLEAMALTDELTGLANRRGFGMAFERELALTRRDAGNAGVLVMIDLDGFKSINDKYGHQAGDAYLRAVAQALQEQVRTSDIVARLGGDEFGILLTHIEEKGGAGRVAKLEQAFHNRWMVWNGKRLPLRASFGMAAYTGNSATDTVMQAADVRLYAHKARNKGLKAEAMQMSMVAAAV